MWISKTPLRISFFSGGDMRSFYTQQPGAVLSCTIDKYIYVMLNDHATIDYDIRTMYDKTEDVRDLNDIKNDIIRETLKMFNLSSGFTIASMTDVPANGTGLGSSSAFTVGLINCCGAAHDSIFTPFELAEHACKLEIDFCGHPIGKQDQYAAAHGGLNHVTFYKSGNVSLEQNLFAAQHLPELEKNMLLVYSGISRSADKILRDQANKLENSPLAFEALERNARRADQGLILLAAGTLNAFGELLHEAWEDKKKVADSISNARIDEIYNVAREAGALGGKLIGAGGGGFFVFYVPKTSRGDVIAAVEELNTDIQTFPFRFVQEGSSVREI